MPQKTSEETIEKIKERMKNGADTSQVAQELGVSKTTVYNYSREFPRKHTRTTIEQRDEMCDLVRQGHSKKEVAKLYHRSVRTIQTITKDIPGYYGYRKTLGPAELRLLQRLFTDGYLVSNYYISTARNLKMQFPMLIHCVRISRKTIFYVVGKEKQAIKGYLTSVSKRIINHTRIHELCNLFGIDLSASEENVLIEQCKFLNIWKKKSMRDQKKLEDFGSEPVSTLRVEDLEQSTA